ncbi:MAG: hypothetical protein Fur002_17420 [Anaerolineales bacterium]
MSRPRQIDEKEIAAFFLLLAALLGGAARAYPILVNHFPLVDGGMFYAMIQDLQAAHFALPQFTSYNHADIPFAYPPLGFYLAGLLNAWAGAPPLEILRWLPLSLSLLNLPLYYYFAKALSNSPPKAALATSLFALTPSSYWWNIVGGGLTRALGALFFTAVLLSGYQMVCSRNRAWALAATFSLAGALLSHPAWALQALTALAVLFLLYGRDRQGAALFGAVIFGAALLTLPWWGSVLARHGADIFLLASQGGYSRWRFWTVFFTLAFTDETVPVLATLGLLGFFIHLARKEWTLPALVLAALFIEPRGGMPAAVFAFSLMAASALTDGIAAAFSPNQNWQASLSFYGGRLFFGFLALLLAYHAFETSNIVSKQSLTDGQIRAMEWIRGNTQPAERFLLFDLEPNPLHSPFTEWFPALAERRSVATIQGSEWLRGEENYVSVYDSIFAMHACVYRDVQCVYALQASLPDSYDYIATVPSPLADSLRASADFTQVYDAEEIEIFRATLRK